MAKSKKKGRKILIFALIVLVVGGLAAAAFLRKRDVIITVQTEKVARRNLTELVTANGRIQPVFYVKISPEVSGEIIALPVKEGQSVKKGDLLVKIKPDVYVAAKNSSEASYKASLSGKQTAEANLTRAEYEYQRNEAMYNAKLVSESVFIDAKTSYEVAKAQYTNATHQVEMAKAALDRANEDLSKTVINSPLDGTVIRLNSQLGERVVGTAMMAGTEIMIIADLSEMEARVDVGEIDVPLIKIGETARLEIDSYKDRKFTGTVTEIANSSKGLTLGPGMLGSQSQEATKFEVKIRIKEKEVLRPGMSVTAEIETRYRTNVLTVPIASVTTRLPKPPESDKAKKPGEKAGATNQIAGSTNAAPPANSASATPTNSTSTNLAASTSATNTTASTNATAAKKPGEPPKPIEVVFLKEGDVAKMVPVKRGISDNDYTEIEEGVQEGQDVISGGYKAISRELEDGKKIRIGPAGSDKLGGRPGEKSEASK